MLKLLKNESVFQKARLLYIILLLVYATLRQNITALQPVLMLSALNYMALFLAGLLFLWDILFFKNVLKTKYVVLLGGVFILTVAVSLINFRYTLFENIKAAANMFIQFFVLYATGNKMSKERINHEVRMLINIFSLVWFIPCFISLIQYFLNISYTQVHYLWGDPVEIVQGFVRYHDGAVVMRLWGVFIDPNFAAMISIIAVSFGLYIVIAAKSKTEKVLHILNILVQYLYIVLSNSRTALLILYLVLFVGAWYLALPHIGKIKKVKSKLLTELLTVLVAIVMVCVGYAGVKATRFALPYAQNGILSVVEFFSGGDSNDKDDKDKNDKDDKDKHPDKIESLERLDIDSKGDISNGRFSMWAEGLTVFAEYPILGCAPRSYRTVATEIDPQMSISTISIHNSYLELLMGNGGLGSLLLIIFFVLCAKDAIVFRYKKKETLFLVGVLMAIVLGCLACGMFISCLFYYLSGISIVAFVLLGYAMNLIHSDDNHERIQEEGGKKKILIYGPKDPAGGVEKIVLDYVKNIVNSHDDITFDFLVYGDKLSYKEEIEKIDCRVLFIPSRKQGYFKYRNAIKKVFLENNYIAVWGNYAGLTNIDLLTFAKEYNVPVRIAHSHGSRFYWGNTLMKFVVPVLHYYNSLRIDDYATDYFACSRVAGEFMFPRWVHKKIRLINNAVDVKTFRPDAQMRNEVRKELGFSEETLVVGHVARMCQIKNQGFLLKIFSEIVNKKNDSKLLFVGSGELREEIENEIKNLGISENVILAGERKDVARLLQAMNVYVLTSLSEGLSVSAVEAQASGIPCVVPTAVSSETDITGFVKFLSLDEDKTVWAEEIIAQAEVDTEDATERIVNSGYDISSEAEKLYKRFMNII